MRRFDFALAGSHISAAECLYDAIAVAEPAGGLAVLDSSAQSAVGLRGQIFQEQRVHRPFEPDVQMRDVAFGERDDVDAGKGETLEEPGGVFLVATEAVQRFSKHDVEAAIQRVPHQSLETRAQQRSAVIGELLDNRKTLASGELATDT